MPRIAEIWRYPVKSLGGESLLECSADANGLHGDRRWALIDGEVNRAGKRLTARQHERLLLYRARLVGHAAEVSTPTGETRAVDELLVSDLASEARRPLTLRDRAGDNFDDSPVLVVNTATIAAFAVAAGMEADHRRFRANLYVEGLEAEAELRWLGRTIRAGSTNLEVVSRCERCVIITRDPDTAIASPELLHVLTQTQDTCMGVYCRVVRPGRVAVGDAIGPE